MAFSLKWLLAGSAYTALAAAALSTGHWAYVDVLWAVTFFAVAYAILGALFARDKRQIVAAGFAVASILLLTCLHLSPDSVPTARLVVLAAANFRPPAPRLVDPLYDANLTPQAGDNDAPILRRRASMDGGRTVSAFLASRLNDPSQLEWVAIYRAANALATMGAGLIGALLGAAVYRRQSRSTQPYARPV
jgi:hypothetical protein